MTVREIISQGGAQLKAAGIETSGLDASLLLAHVLGVSRTSLAANGTNLLSGQALIAYDDLIKRRLKGECTAYITGKKEFFNYDFMVNQSVLVPRPDTEILAEAALKILGSVAANARQLYVLDLCTGCGAIAVSIKHEIPSVEIFAADISAQALIIAKINAKRILPETSMINFHQGNLFKALRNPPPFSLIVSNPPYIPSGEIKTLSKEVQNEPRLALDGGRAGLKIIKKIIRKAPHYLEKGGALLLEADPRQMKDIAIMLEKSGFSNIELYNDLSGQERVISGIFDKKQ